MKLEDIYKILASSLLSIILTGGAMWFTIGQHAVSRAEMQEYITNNSPYTRDRALIFQQTAWSKEAIDSISIKLDLYTIQVAKLETKIDLLLKDIDDLKQRKP